MKIKNKGVSEESILVADKETLVLLNAKLAETARLNDLKYITILQEKDTVLITELAKAETRRVDGLRVVDNLAVEVQRKQASEQAIVLSTQLDKSANENRILVDKTAATLAAGLSTITDQFTKQISEIKQTLYDNKGEAGIPQDLLLRLASIEKELNKSEGKGSVTDPIQVEMLKEIKALRDYNSKSTGFAGGLEKFWAVLLAIAALVYTIYKSTH